MHLRPNLVSDALNSAKLEGLHGSVDPILGAEASGLGSPNCRHVPISKNASQGVTDW